MTLLLQQMLNVILEGLVRKTDAKYHLRFYIFPEWPLKIYKYIHFNTLIKVLYALRKYKSYKLLKVAKTFKINPESYKNLFYKESLISSHHPQINGGTREGWIYNSYGKIDTKIYKCTAI